MSVGVDTQRDRGGHQAPPKEALQDGFVYKLWRPISLHYADDPPTVRSLFLLAAARHIAAGQSELALCPWCGKPYLPDPPQQRYCTKDCTQAAIAKRKGRAKTPPRASIPGLESVAELTKAADAQQKKFWRRVRESTVADTRKVDEPAGQRASGRRPRAARAGAPR